MWPAIPILASGLFGVQPTVCRRYCIHRIVGGPYDRVALFILDVTGAGQRDGAQHRYL